MTDVRDDTPDGAAAAWYARLRSGTMTEAEHRALADWRLADPAHAAAWAQVDAIWQAIGSISDDPAVRAMRAAARAPTPARAPVRWWPYAGIAAAAALVVAVSTTLLPRLETPRPRSEAIAYAQPREIVTRPGHQTHVDLTDGSTIIVAPRSHVRIGPWDSERRVTLLDGEAHFSVAHAAQRFVVHAGHASVTAVGTAFTVARAGGRVRTVLEQGRIRVTPDERGGAGVIVDAGHAVTIDGGRIASTTAIDADDDGSWTRGELVFAATPLGDAVTRYNRYAAQPVRIAGAGIARTPITGRFRIGGKSGFVDMIAAAGIVRVTHDADGPVLTSPRK